MGKKLLLFSFFLFVLGLFTSNVSAQRSTGTNSALIINKQRTEIRQEIKDNIQAKREEVKKIVATKRAEFETKLQSLKDEKKKILVGRIDIKLSEVNTKHTDSFTELLGRLQELLDKQSVGVTDPKTLADIKTAQTAINAAKIAVENQAAKTYTIQIVDEANLRLNVGTTVSQLRKDLMATHKLVVDAKQAVQNLRKDDLMIKKQATGSANL